MSSEQRNSSWLTSPAVWFYPFSLGYMVLWSLLATPDYRHFFVREGGPIDWLSSTYLLTAMAIVAVTWLGGRKPDWPGSWFWLVCWAALAFVLLDERFQIHEMELQTFLRQNLGQPGPFRWNDLVLSSYAVIGVIVGWQALPILRRYRRTAGFILVAIVFYGLHGGLDMLVPSDSDATYAWLAEISEETTKLLTGTSLLLAFLSLARARAAEQRAVEAGNSRWELGWGFVVAIFAVMVMPTMIVLTAGPSWAKRLSRLWGDPGIWVASICLAAAALLVFLCSSAKSSSAPARKLWLVTACAGLFFAFDEATLACSYRFEHKRVVGRFPELLTDGVSILREPSGISGLIVLGFVVLVATLAWRLDAHSRIQHLLLAFAATALIADLVAFRVVPGRAPMAEVIAGACLFLAALSRFVEIHWACREEPLT